jgi:hypothetical protein
MAELEDARAIASGLPETVEETGRFGFGVTNRGKVKGFVWTWLERIDSKKARVPNPSVLGVRVPGEAEKQMLIAADPEKFFTEPHYDGFPAVLVRLAVIDVEELRELLTDAWRIQAPKDLVRRFDEEHPSR